jgi:hypothetical protein
MKNDTENDSLNTLVAALQQQLTHLQNTDNSQFDELDKLLQQAADSEAGKNIPAKDNAALLQFLSQQIDAADTVPLKEKIITRAIEHLQGCKGGDMAGKVQHLVKNILADVDAEEKIQQTKTEKERNERINEAAGNSIAAALKRHGF